MEEVKLNPYIFNDIIPYIIYNEISFNKILDLSLLSKSTFKSFQTKIILNKKLPLSLFEFIKYLKIDNKNNNNNNNDDNNNISNTYNIKDCNIYNLKLIQYKELETIKISSLQENKKEIDCILGINTKNTNSNGQVKDFLTKHLVKLRKVVVDNLFIKTYPPCFSNYDYTCNNFFKVKNCYVYWDHSNPPLSHGERIYDYNGYDDYDLSSHNYYFNFITNVKPSKLIIETSVYNPNNYFEDIHISDLETLIFECQESIKSIDFVNHFTPLKLIESIFNPNNDIDLMNDIEQLTIPKLKELSIILTPSEINKLCQLVSNNNNKNICKLILKSTIPSYETKSDTVNNFYNPSRFLKELFSNGNNNSIRTLGLNLFKINDPIHLSPLLEYPNINTIYCDSYSVEPFLQHINENKKIIKIIYQISKNLYTTEKEDTNSSKKEQKKRINVTQIKNDFNIQTNIFNQFFKNNKSTNLKSITILKYGEGINRNSNNGKINQFIKTISDLYCASKNPNNHFILNFK
ncbi:hypothetical protein DICPUDRAFT_75731 [Dictyostelium purpureum]|uniref:Uncharacterized protein n=1 Tax=Dictyostelium purpureum TaxID=5786 RepID=F0ZBI3_DICPU|nr:uncharacterized protein DICPUDRAFT_75731 [Dictyostelium purpureum]EGC38700.1 hypothetical protein DICPUDRAFT_75731 [Dictyostelium purpureum]|eukprot:XP_003284796.1 hypothetical protein DICPUDRAFT_75731 [Dictyostelium purpureum]